MAKSYKIVCFIPARSGSKRLKDKNIKKLNGKPLIFWTVKQAIRVRIFKKIIFSTDSLKYYKILIKTLKQNNLSTKKIHLDLRNLKNSSSKKKIFDYIKYNFIKLNYVDKNDLLVQLLPTAPLRSLKTIKKVINLAIKKKKNIFSVSEYDFHISFALEKFSNCKWRALIKKSPLKTGNTRSQDQKKYFKPNPVINCLWTKYLKNNKTIYDNALAFETTRNEGHDIDNLQDFKLAEFLMKYNFKR
ncbi:hypothetical protein AKH19_06620 [Pelagibacteraceae bacterium GOM-A1]|nr:hypothetical protein AKH19_06620 [Pelagibacteraceae bacterium GOM-A1]